MPRFFTILGYVAFGLFCAWLSAILLDTVDDVAYELSRWLRRRFLPGAVWVAIIGLCLFGINEIMRPGSR